MVGFIARGRIAWVLAAVLGAVLLILGIVMSQTLLVFVGIASLAFGIIFLAMSIASGGRTD